MKNPTWLKLLVLVLTFAMLLSLVACGPDEEETSGTVGGTQAEQPTEGDNETTDKGNDATNETTTESESASDTESEVGSGTTTETETDEETTTETDEETTTETDEETTTEEPECDHQYDGYKTDADQHWQECTVCGETTDKTDHEFEDKKDDTNHWKVCSECKYETEKVAHTLEEKYDTKDHWQKCSGCDHTTEKVAHTLSYESDETSHWQECSECEYATSKVDCAISGDLTFNGGESGDNKYHGECVCGREFESYFLVQKKPTNRVQNKAPDGNVTVTTNDDGSKTYAAGGGDNWFFLYNEGKVETGKFVVIKYKTTTLSSLTAGFAGTVHGENTYPQNNGDLFKDSVALTKNGKWQLLVLDITDMVKNVEKFADDGNGNYYARYLRFTVAKGANITIDFVAFADETDAIKNYINAEWSADTETADKYNCAHKILGDNATYKNDSKHEFDCLICGAKVEKDHTLNGVAIDGSGNAGGHKETCTVCNSAVATAHTAAGEKVWNGTAYATSCTKCSEDIAQPFLATIWAKDLNSSGNRTTSTYVEATDDEVAYRQYKSTAVHADGLGANKNDQYWTIFSYGANGPVTGQYFIMKYRNAYSSNVTIYKSTTATGAGSRQAHSQTLETTLGWHVLIVDLTTVTNPITKDVDTDGDGENDAYAINFMRFGFGTEVPADKVLLEVAYIGFSDDLSKVGLALDELDDNNYHKHTFETKASLNCKYCGAKPYVLSIDYVQEGSSNQQFNIPGKNNVTSVQGNPKYYDASSTVFTMPSIHLGGWAAVDNGMSAIYYQVNNGEWIRLTSSITPGSNTHKGFVEGTTTALTNYLDKMCFGASANLSNYVGQTVTVKFAFTYRGDTTEEKQVFVVVENIKVYCDHQYSDEAPGACSVCGQERYYVDMDSVKVLTSADQDVAEGTVVTDPASTTAYNGSYVAYSASGVSVVSSGAAIYLEGSVAINGGVQKYYYQTNNGSWQEWTGVTASNGTEIAGDEVGDELTDYTENMNFSGVITLPDNTSTKSNKTVKVAIAAMNADGEMFVIAVVNNIVISKVASPS